MISMAGKEKRHCQMNRQYNNGSFDALWFGYSTTRSQTASTLDEPMVKAAVHPMPAIKSYINVLRKMLQHQMNRHYT
jgi:hypothetical protein